MGTGRFEPGAQVVSDGVTYAVTRKIGNAEWQLEESQTKRIVTMTEREIRNKLADATLRLPGSGAIIRRGPADSDLSGPELEVAKLRRLYVLAVEHVPNTRKALQMAIDETWKRLGAPTAVPSYSTVYRWKRRFFSASKDVRALLDNHMAKGRRGGRYPSEVENICRKVIDAVYMTRVRPTIQAVVDESIHRVLQENGLRPTEHPLQLPTRRFIARLVSAIPAYDKCAARYGSEYARKSFRSVKGHITVEAPLERAEIDHTQLDVMVIDDASGLPLGRPWLTICMDVYTRCILGIYIGFNPPSYRTVAACLKDCFLPKSRLRERYPKIETDWPAFGVMQNLVVDGGREFVGKDLEQVCLSLNITLHQSPRRQPWSKPFVERLFGTINSDLIHAIPGTTFSNIFDKGDYDPKKQAAITLELLQASTMRYITDVYHQRPHGSIQTTPFTLWNQQVRLEDIRVPDDTTELDAVMGKSYTRVLDHKGIDVDGLRYNSAELTEWRSLYGTRLEVEVRIDESDLGFIYVLSPRDSSSLKVPCLHAQYANGISSWQHAIFKSHQRKINSFESTPTGWLRAKQEIKAQIEHAFSTRSKKIGKRTARALEDQGRLRGASSISDPVSTVATAPTRESTDVAVEKFFEALPLRPATNSGDIPVSNPGKKLKAMYRKGF